MVAMPKDFTPGPSHVICAKGKQPKEHRANILLKSLVKANLDEYSECSTKLERSFIVSRILKTIRQDGGFVRQVEGRWYEVGDRNAREKIGQAFRDLLHTQFRSSTKAKASIRKERGEDSLSHSTNSRSRASPSNTKKVKHSSYIRSPSAPLQSEQQPHLEPVPQRSLSEDSFPISEVSFNTGGSHLHDHGGDLHRRAHLHPHPEVTKSFSSSHHADHQLKDLEPLPLSHAVELNHAKSNANANANPRTITNGLEVSHPLQLSHQSSLGSHAGSSGFTFETAMQDLYSHMSRSARSASFLMRGHSLGVNSTEPRPARPDPPTMEDINHEKDDTNNTMSTPTAIATHTPPPQLMSHNLHLHNDHHHPMNMVNPMTTSQFLSYQQFSSNSPMISIMPTTNTTMGTSNTTTSNTTHHMMSHRHTSHNQTSNDNPGSNGGNDTRRPPNGNTGGDDMHQKQQWKRQFD